MQRFLILIVVLFLASSPAIADVYYEKAKKSYGAEKYRKAQKYLKKSLKNEPENIPAQSLLAETFSAQKNFKGAIKIYKDLLKKNPDNIRILSGLGNVYSKGEFYRDAVGVYNIILEKEPDNIMALYMLGMNKALCMDLDEAYSVYRRLKKKDQKLAANLLHQIQGF